ncbi:hypothetical protein RYA05_03605 [Pseudomonas syringae pv. actinidiae]|nr:hypothetical protein [Pseudomonas syringae pv. actinidiae]
MKKSIALGLCGLLLSGSAFAQALRYNYTLSSTIPYDWKESDPTFTKWTDVGGLYSCSNWSPSTSTFGKGTAFTQTATDCKQDQERTGQNREQDTRTGIYQNVGDPFKETRVVTETDSREAVGILENWGAIDPTYTEWKDTNVLYGCSAWSPDPAAYSMTTSFTQLSSCKTDQERERQDREKEEYTAEIRNAGSPVVENKTLPDQKATRPYSVTLGQWESVGEPFSCANWSPDTATTGKSVAFKQTATDCKVNQSRTRAESYVDHKTSNRIVVPKANETKVLTGQSNARDAIGTREDWTVTDSIYGAWTNTPGMVQYACSNWSPNPAARTTAGTFAQAASDCKIDQTRTRQDREIEGNTKEVRNKGELATEKQTLSGQGATRNYTVALSAWTNNGNLSSCSNWSPDPSTVTINQAFTQTATDCQQPQKRTRSESYVDHLSGSVVAVSGVTQTQSIVASDSRSAIGTKETWASSPSVYSAWANSGAVAGCTAWSPSPSSYTVRTQFTQTGTGCSVSQTRSRQDQEKETTTGAIRNKGALATETQTVGGQSTTRTYLMDFSGWVWSGDNYNCSAWSPDPSTVTTGTVFTQSATCSRNQTRAAAGYTVVNGNPIADSAVPYRVETQVIGGQAITQNATGTKETWVASASVYSAWANTAEVSGCSAWSPSPSSYTARTQFTQTGTGCSVPQSRTRQDQQKETTTGAVRNTGAAVTETQTASGQTTTRSYLMDFSDWAWSGDYYNCSAWAPAVSTVKAGTAFTQTQSCSRNQQRGAAGYTLVNGNWASDAAVPYRVETQVLGGQTKSQAATGTMSSCVYVANSTYWLFVAAPDHKQYIQAMLNGKNLYTAESVGQTAFYYGGQLYSRGTAVTGGQYSLCLP